MKLATISILVAFLLLPINTIGQESQSTIRFFTTKKDIICAQLDKMMDFFEQKYDETLKMQINTPHEGIFNLILHSPNNTVTILETNGKIACVLSTGKIEPPGDPA